MVTADYIRAIFEYNYARHRQLWSCIMHLGDEQFVQDVPYSIGSIRNHLVHVTGVDARWLARIQETPVPDPPNYADYPTRVSARSYYDMVEKQLLDFAAHVDDAALQKIIHFELKQRNIVSNKTAWQILIHVVNHGTDHRAQVLRILHEMGAPTFEQDIMLYWFDQES